MFLYMCCVVCGPSCVWNRVDKDSGDRSHLDADLDGLAVSALGVGDPLGVVLTVVDRPVLHLLVPVLGLQLQGEHHPPDVHVAAGRGGRDTQNSGSPKGSHSPPQGGEWDRPEHAEGVHCVPRVVRPPLGSDTARFGWNP